MRGLKHFAASLLVPALVPASTIFEHTGMNAPSTEGWTQIGAAVGVTEGAIANDSGSGFDAWFIDDDSLASNSVLRYEQNPTAGQVALGNAAGWSLRGRLRIVDVPDATSILLSVFMSYGDGSQLYSLAFGSQADGDPIVILRDGGISGSSVSGTTFALEGGGSGHHLYELIFDPIANNADLFVNGAEVVSNYAGFASAGTPLVTWGSGTSADTGHGNYNLVQFNVAPEGGSLWLMGFGLAALAAGRRLRPNRRS